MVQYRNWTFNPTVQPTPPPEAGVGTMILRYTGGTTDGPLSGTTRYGLVDLGYRPSDLAYIKANNPSEKVVCYKSASDCQEFGGNPTANSCATAISYDEALAHDNANPTDQWLLRDSAGNPIWDIHYTNPKNYLPNMGSRTYQQQVLLRVRATLTTPSPKFDGIFWDNTNPAYLYRSSAQGYATPPGGGTRSILTDATWKTNILAFHTAVSDPLRGSGFYVMANGGVLDNDGSITNSWWTSGILSHLNGVMEEYWMQGADGILYFYDPSPTDWHGHYNGWLTIVDTAQNQGVDFYPGGHGTQADTAKMMYIKASFLLKWHGRGGGMFWAQSDGTDPWNAAWTTPIGFPSADLFAVSTGWRRNYSGGTVIVNPNKPSLGNITFNLGANYVDPSGATVSSVTLTPTTAMILTTP